MNRPSVALCLALLALFELAFLPSGYAQDEAANVPRITLKNRGVKMAVLPDKDFARLRDRTLGGIPTAAEDVRTLANFLLGKEKGANARAFIVSSLDGEGDEASQVICGEHLYGKLFAALQNPDLDEAVRNDVAADLDQAVPQLNETETFGHFRFFYTTSDDDPQGSHAVTREDIKSTAKVLNDAWDDYAANFREPKHLIVGDQKIIDVRVYDLPTNGLFGVTASMWDHMELDSVLVVADPCKRQTTPVHELFHRVQYSYGYTSGAEEMKWAVEATAAWSQKHRARNVGDYKPRVKFGLETPDVTLLDRSYDAAHFWIFMGQRAGNEMEFVRDCWQGYQGNGMLDPVRAVVLSKIGQDLESSIANWHYANVRKEVNPNRAEFGYEENKESVNCDGNVYGPLRKVVTETHVLTAANSPLQSPGNVSRFGADHHRYRIPVGARKIKLTVTPAAGEAVLCGCTAVNGEDVVDEVTPRNNLPFVYEVDFGDNPVTDVILTVVGAPAAASYTVAGELP